MVSGASLFQRQLILHMRTSGFPFDSVYHLLILPSRRSLTKCTAYFVTCNFINVY